MSNTVNVGNFSVECFHSPTPVVEGEPVLDYENSYLELIPDAGYVIDANNFSAITPLPDYVSSVTFFQSTQNANNVICEVQLIPGTVMPAGGIDINLCIAGSSATDNYCVEGAVSYSRVANVVPATLNETYSLCGSFKETENVFTQSVSATPGYYFATQPTISLTAGNSDRYTVTSSNVLDVDGNIVNTVFTVNYTFIDQDITGDAWEIEAVAQIIFVPIIEVTGYNIATSAFPTQGGFRYYTVFGSPGAAWTLTASDSILDTGLLTPIQFQPIFGTTVSGVLDANGSSLVGVRIPQVTSSATYDITISGQLQSPFSQNLTVTLLQFINVTVTYTASGTGMSVTPASYTKIANAYRAYDPSLTTDTDFTVTPTNPLDVLILNPLNTVVIQNESIAPLQFTNTTAVTSTVHSASITPLPATPYPTGYLEVGMNFTGNTQFATDIEITNLDVPNQQITFNRSITVQPSQLEQMSFNKGNMVEFLGYNVFATSPSSFNIGGLPSISRFGWDNATFNWILDDVISVVALPTVVTTGVSNETGTTADSGGETITDGNGTISVRGVEWSSLADFSVIDGTTTDGTGTTNYASTITGLTAGNTYYVRAYVINEAGIAYGQVIQFVSSVSFPCGANIPSGGVGITDINVNLDSAGGLLAFAFNAQGRPDKMEIIHGTASGTKVATTSLAASGNSGPFDNTYGTEPTNTIPTTAQAIATAQFIGTDIQNPWTVTKQTEFNADTGFSVPTMTISGTTYQQIVWWQYTTADFQANPIATVRITGSDNTSWDAVRLCCPDTNCTLPPLP